MTNEMVRISLTTLFTIILVTRAHCQSSRSGAVSDYPADEEYIDESDSSTPLSETVINTPVSHIYTRPQQYVVEFGKAVRLPCNVSYPENVVVTWMRNGSYLLYSGEIVYVNENDKTRIIRDADGGLVIYGFSENDEATYTCTITDTSESVTHTVRLKRPPTTTTSTTTASPRPLNPSEPHTKKLEVRPGENFVFETPNADLTLSCLANWTPSPRITWSFMGERLKSDDNPPDGSHLTIRNVTIEKAGSYACLANETPSQNEAPVVGYINVIVPHAPVVTVDQERVHIGRGMEAELTCRVHAYPTPTIVWHKAGQKLGLTNKPRNTIRGLEINSTIIINHVDKEKLAHYTCRATNDLGFQEGTIELTGAPKEPKFEGCEVDADGVTPILVWTVESFAPITKWKLMYRAKNETKWHVIVPKIEESMSSTSTVREPIPGLQPGLYQTIFEVWNDDGQSTSKQYTFEGGSLKQEPPIDLKNPSNGVAESSAVLRPLLLVLPLLHVYATYL